MHSPFKRLPLGTSVAQIPGKPTKYKNHVLTTFRITKKNKVLRYAVAINHIVDTDDDEPRVYVERVHLSPALAAAKYTVDHIKVPRNYTYRVTGIVWDHPNPRSENLHSTVTVKHTKARATDTEVVEAVEKAYHYKINHAASVECLETGKIKVLF